MDRALAALCAEHRAAGIDRTYRVFVDAPNASPASLTSRLGRLSGLRMQQVCAALAVAMDCR